MCDIAERASAGTDTAHDHEGRGAMFKAFTDIWTSCLFTDGMQVVLTQDGFEVGNRG